MRNLEEKFVRNTDIKQIMLKYRAEKRFGHIPSEDKKKILNCIRSELNDVLRSNGYRIDGAEDFASKLLNLELANPQEKFSQSTWISAALLWMWIAPEVNDVSYLFTAAQVIIPEGDEQKELQQEYLAMMADAAKALIRKAVDNFDELATIYISDSDLEEIIKNHCANKNFAMIPEREKRLMIRRLRIRVAEAIDYNANIPNGEREIAKYLLQLENVDNHTLRYKMDITRELPDVVYWLKSFMLKDSKILDDIFEVDRIEMPQEEAGSQLSQVYVEFVASATKALIAQAAKAFGDEETNNNTFIRRHEQSLHSILKPAKRTQDSVASQISTMPTITQAVATESTPSTDTNEAKKRRVAYEASATTHTARN